MAQNNFELRVGEDGKTKVKIDGVQLQDFIKSVEVKYDAEDDLPNVKLDLIIAQILNINDVANIKLDNMGVDELVKTHELLEQEIQERGLDATY